MCIIIFCLEAQLIAEMETFYRMYAFVIYMCCCYFQYLIFDGVRVVVVSGGGPDEGEVQLIGVGACRASIRQLVCMNINVD